MSWMTREGKCAEKLVEVASMHDVSINAWHKGRCINWGCRQILSEFYWGNSCGLYWHWVRSRHRQMRARLMLDKDEEGDGRGVSSKDVGHFPLFTPIIWWGLRTNGRWSILLGSRCFPSGTCGYTPYLHANLPILLWTSPLFIFVLVHFPKFSNKSLQPVKISIKRNTGKILSILKFQSMTPADNYCGMQTY